MAAARANTDAEGGRIAELLAIKVDMMLPLEESIMDTERAADIGRT
jgi:hypothetical protein